MVKSRRRSVLSGINPPEVSQSGGNKCLVGWLSWHFCKRLGNMAAYNLYFAGFCLLLYWFSKKDMKILKFQLFQSLKWSHATIFKVECSSNNFAFWIKNCFLFLHVKCFIFCRYWLFRFYHQSFMGNFEAIWTFNIFQISEIKFTWKWIARNW